MKKYIISLTILVSTLAMNGQTTSLPKPSAMRPLRRRRIRITPAMQEDKSGSGAGQPWAQNWARFWFQKWVPNMVPKMGPLLFI